jgi:di/tricarboxylate transporter
MQEVELGLIVASTLAILVVLALRTRAHLRDRPIVIGAILGIVPGILGAVIVLVPRTDLIPDSAEPFLWLLVGLVATGIVLVAVSVGFARR